MFCYFCSVNIAKMSTFFYSIEDLFVHILFSPYDGLRFMKSWWVSNIVNWTFTLVGLVAIGYWMKQLKIFDAEGGENESISSHSYL